MGFGKIPDVLKKHILIEYLGGMAACLVLLSVAFAVYRRRRERAASENAREKIDRAWRIAAAVIAALIFVGYPVWIFIACRQEIGELRPALWKILVNTMIAAPAAVVVLFFLLGNRIDGWLTRRQYRNVAKSIPADSRKFRSAADFCADLKSRGLFFGEKDRLLLKRMNSRHFDASNGNPAGVYTEATVMPLTEKEFRDSPDCNEVLSPDSTEPHPAYVYNAILVKPGKDEELQYAPISRYAVRAEAGEDPAYENDFYIECKILYLERFLYAVIGVGESRAVEGHFPGENKPYYTVLIDEEPMDHYHNPGPLTVYTYVDGCFCPFGMIRDTGTGFEMLPDDHGLGADKERPRYKVASVPHLDRGKIDCFAAKLADEFAADH